ncbi:probable calcium-binding protein CML23 [Momordica charantia]|uniref:Probable calcium-binding protein CML23 n=1 Tax=Momordica charantia TaxID=3673 RepID=A0A6J1CNU4_MOMCH|nr:probable calcium-binding protein CML23 [Momordica charantia]
MPMAKKSVSDPSSTNLGGALGSMDEVTKVFNKFDKNGDGKISVNELGDALGELGGKVSSDEVRRIMAEIDKDGDGFIDLDEFAEFHQDVSATGGGNKDLQDAFDLYDIDKNGLISAKELHSVLKRLGEKCSLKDCCRMISSVDVDGDGHVNFEEFKKMMTRS